MELPELKEPQEFKNNSKNCVQLCSEYIWDNWGSILKDRGITHAKFLRLSKKCKNDFLSWCNGELAWSHEKRNLLKNIRFLLEIQRFFGKQ